MTGHVLPGEPKGTTSNVDGAYFTSAPASAPTSEQQNEAEVGRKTALVLLTDMFGLALSNPRILADRFAERLGCDVYVPDLFEGHPPIDADQLQPYTPDVPNTHYSLWNRLTYYLLWIPKLPSLWANRPSVGRAKAEQFIQDLKDKKGYTDIGVIGYCYGGGIAVGLATKKGFVNVLVACHPGPITESEFPHVLTPLAMFCSQEDPWVTPPKRARAEAALAKLDTVETKVETLPGTVHGFAARPNLGIPQVRDAFERTFEECVQWIQARIHRHE